MSSATYSPFPSCFRAPASNSDNESPGSPSTVSCNPNVTTSIYDTAHGLFTLTWSKSLLSRSLSLHLESHENVRTPFSQSDNTLFFHLTIKPIMFWKKHGSKKISFNSQKVRIFWDLRKSRFGSRPEPESGFYLAVLISGEMTLLAGDLASEAYAKAKCGIPRRVKQTLVQKREHAVLGSKNRVYKTKTEFGNRVREIKIETSSSDTNSDDLRLFFSVDDKRVLQVKHLKWKFRGNERVEIDGVQIHVSWDVYSWFFDENNVDHNNNNSSSSNNYVSNNNNKHALFMFRFEKSWFNEEHELEESRLISSDHHQNSKNHFESKLGFFGFGAKKASNNNNNKCTTNNEMVIKTPKSSFSSSSISSSASSGCNSSVLEWASLEEKELESTNGFSLLVHAWKS